MGQRSRKRGRREKAPEAAPAPRTRGTAKNGTQGSPAAGRASGSDAAGRASATATATKPRSTHGSRSAERDAAIRAGLKPLEPGEKPLAILIGAVLALLSGLLQLALFLGGVKLNVAGTHAKAGSTIVFGAMMVVCAAGMWYLRYWAVLGFMAILGITVAYFSLALIKASSLLGFAISIAGVVLGGWLFYKLVRALSRIQMPEYPGR